MISTIKQVLFRNEYEYDLSYTEGRIVLVCYTVGRKKKVQAKKAHEIIYINFTKFFLTKNPFLTISKTAQNQFLNLKKV